MRKKEISMKISKIWRKKIGRKRKEIKKRGKRRLFRETIEEGSRFKCEFEKMKGYDESITRRVRMKSKS